MSAQDERLKQRCCPKPRVIKLTIEGLECECACCAPCEPNPCSESSRKDPCCETSESKSCECC